MPTSSRTALPLSPWRQHVADWRNCTRCHLHRDRRNVCLLRGDVPADVLFVGEAPGHSEDVEGLPFFGPAGHLLERIIEEAFDGLGVVDANDELPRTARMAFTNVVGCIPLVREHVDFETDATAVRKATEPDPESIKACRPRVVEIVRIVRPRLVVTLGKVAAKNFPPPAAFAPVDWLPSWQGQIAFVEVLHPAAIGRLPTAQRVNERDRAVARIRTAVEEL